ncbi:MAG: helix-turn-helix domain-containing protein [Dermatophilaceae bacterium]
MTRIALRNVDADPSDAVETWPYEALVAAIERGTISTWVRITSAIDREPWGDVARQIEEYLRYASPYGVGPLLHRALARSKAHAEARERAEVAAEIADLIERTGLPVTDVARRIGTSRTRLSTYRSGRVIPSATLLVRLRALADRIGHAPSPDKPAG